MSRGGWRSGAGRPGYRAKAEQLQRVDVRIWRLGGYLVPGCVFHWSWNRGGEPTGSIGVRVQERDAVRLEYAVGPPDSRRDASQTIRLTHAPCRFGGRRPWFNCPLCARHVAVLYFWHGRFACRHCQRVAYTSQSEDAIGRGWRRQQKIEARLAPNWQRPKGMWRRTFERLSGQVFEIESERDCALAGLLGRLGMVADARSA